MEHPYYLLGVSVMSTESDVRDEIANEVWHDMPAPELLAKMPPEKLAILLSSCEKGSAKFLVVEREWLRRRNEDGVSGLGNKTIWAHPLTKWVLGIIGPLVVAAIIWYFGLK